jgi:hypothetical protein
MLSRTEQDTRSGRTEKTAATERCATPDEPDEAFEHCLDGCRGHRRRQRSRGAASSTAAAPSSTTSAACSRPRLPALNQRPLGSSAARNRIPPQGTHPAACRQRRRARTRRRASIEIRADAPSARTESNSPAPPSSTLPERPHRAATHQPRTEQRTATQASSSRPSRAPLRNVHRNVFGILALEAEPTDPRL